jgi:hypothetical protein
LNPFTYRLIRVSKADEQTKTSATVTTAAVTATTSNSSEEKST